LGGYIPFRETVDTAKSYPILCRDTKDQPFLDLAFCGNADLLITGDEDLLALAG
jgi:putative PIN family toxin of toxin-antitoxin system